jgi:two-component system, NtrC family, sensor kinase
MRSFPLHIKTTVLASIVSLVVSLVGLIVVSASIAKQIQEEQKQLALLQAENLAEQLSAVQNPLDAPSLQNLANIVSGSRPNLITVRLWTLENGKFVESVSSNDSLPVEELSEDLQNSLLQGVDSNSVKLLQNGGDEPLFRVFCPIVKNKRITGAVEAVEKLDTIWSITLHYSDNLAWIMLVTVGLMGIAFYLLIRSLVYEPLEKLLAGMELAKAGDLSVELLTKDRRDEFGRLSDNFNSMMSQIREMTLERERQNEILQEKVRDATAELVRKNEQLETASVELFRTSRKMSEMERLAAAGQTAAQFAHEVGTPLNLISGHAQLLKTKLPEDSNEAKRLNLIAEQIDRIERIVCEMLDRTRFGASERVPVNLNYLIEKIFDAVEPTLEEHKVKLRQELAENLPEIAGDADRLQQVFINLVNNALDAMPTGGELFISTSVKERRIELVFSDNGCGLSEETKAQMYQPLFTTKQRGRGTGLGLFVVKEILQEHDAEIRVESDPARGAPGTRFTLTFPKIESSAAAG